MFLLCIFCCYFSVLTDKLLEIFSTFTGFSSCIATDYEIEQIGFGKTNVPNGNNNFEKILINQKTVSPLGGGEI